MTEYSPLREARKLVGALDRREEDRIAATIKNGPDPAPASEEMTEINELRRVVGYLLDWAESLQVIALIDLTPRETEH